MMAVTCGLGHAARNNVREASAIRANLAQRMEAASHQCMPSARPI